MDYLERRKFEFIERRLYWRGRIKRSDLKEYFSLSESTAAGTFRAYHIERPGVLVLNQSIRAYTPCVDFSPIFYVPNIEHSELDRVGSGLSVEVKRDVLDVLSTCIRECKTMNIKYKGIAGDDTEREIAPICLIRMVSGFPPAIHAWCYMRNATRTFQLPLIESASIGRKLDKPATSNDLEVGEVVIDGIRIDIPKAAIYAAAGQILALPELRNPESSMMIEALTNRMLSAWVNN